jgi:hypothetical protein
MVGYRRPERPEPETYFKAKSSFVGSSLPIGAVVPSLVRAFPLFYVLHYTGSGMSTLLFIPEYLPMGYILLRPRLSVTIRQSLLRSQTAPTMYFQSMKSSGSSTTMQSK